ncbi:hypothetical protein HIU56_10560 [Enterococcus faecium]|uniref:Uncharacterized protein n=2 Tax=Enterococcus TaxID=1350 RepID=A0A8F5V8C0_ENTCA|nr:MULTISPECIES: hypothetical protein [Bacillota]MBV6384571.1 hypothetical protein [Enterococcus faecium]MBV6370937.1 hypothetical protein [Enterococcus casseliflavus]MBV6375218.1 hypothetical protein [Enterococcus casseliflavus]QXO84658.1 hypothetical protein Tn6712_000029 [Enterococcus faecium]QXO84800.1 hypothetical protein Tn6713_000029 [Enterococcus casseliflavus]
MNKKDQKRHMAYEVLVLLGMLALLTFICRLWPILLLIILGIFAAMIRLLFLSSRKIEVIVPLPLLPEPVKETTEKDVQVLAYSVILRRVTELVLSEYPEARWVWEAPNAEKLIQESQEVFILLNRAGGYRRAKVVIRNLQVVGIEYNPQVEENAVLEPEDNAPEPEEEPEVQNYELLAFEWADVHIFELNARCNEAIGENLSELILLAEELPVRESWADICRELIRAGLTDVQCVSEGIKINLTQSNAERK